jgi:hypothetical protein
LKIPQVVPHRGVLPAADAVSRGPNGAWRSSHPSGRCSRCRYRPSSNSPRTVGRPYERGARKIHGIRLGRDGAALASGSCPRGRLGAAPLATAHPPPIHGVARCRCAAGVVEGEASLPHRMSTRRPLRASWAHLHLYRSGCTRPGWKPERSQIVTSPPPPAIRRSARRVRLRLTRVPAVAPGGWSVSVPRFEPD